MVVLPDGFYYGNLDPDSAMDTVEAHLAGIVLPDQLRGMARFLPPVQAAVAAAYQRYGPLGPSDVTVRSTEHIGPHHGHGSETIVELAIEPQQRLLTVRVLVCATPRSPADLPSRAGDASHRIPDHRRQAELRPSFPGKWSRTTSIWTDIVSIATTFP